MQPAPRTSTKSKEKGESTPDEKLKKISLASTPQNYLQKSSTSDIYSQKKQNVVQGAKPTKKVPGLSNISSNVTPIKGQLKSSTSAVSQHSSRSVYENDTRRSEKRLLSSARSLKAKESPLLSRRSTGDTTLSTRKSTIETPLPTRKSTKDSPLPTRKATTESPLSTRKSTKEFPLPTKKSTKESPLPTRKSTKDSPLTTRKATTESPLSTRKSITESLRKSVTSKQKIETSKSLDAPYVRRYKNNELPINVTVNSPPVKRRLNLDDDDDDDDEKTKNTAQNLDRGDSKENERFRSKTRTLNENEVKTLSPDQNVVDNNEEMKKLTKKLSAKPKAFFVDLEEKERGEKPKSSDEEFDYEDDFESYESDFESYHSDKTNTNNGYSDDEEAGEQGTNDEQEHEAKEMKDEENMLDSGSFDLRDQRSAKAKHTIMDFINEDTEDPEEKRPSLTDEGFQEMSSSSAVSSMKAGDGLDRPMFMDFAKSKEKKRKRRLFEHQKQRALDLLGMITLHQMSFSLFEMKPIPYDLFMITYGRSNCIQVSTQTFDDGISEEIQTEEIVYDCKWTQHPIEFSNSDIYLKDSTVSRKYSNQNEDLFIKFSILMNNDKISEDNKKINLDESYKNNPLRVYLEQKDGAGNCEILARDKYKTMTQSTCFNVNKLSKFLKKVEGNVSHVLSSNTRDKISSEFAQTSKLPYSKSCITIEPKKIRDEKLTFLKNSKIIKLIMSENKSNLVMSVHTKCSNALPIDKCLICLWDTSVSTEVPVKILVAIDDIAVGVLRGDTDGIFVAALNDSSIHLWDLSEEPTWRIDVASEEKPAEFVETSADRMTQTEKDREWNLRNSHVGFEQPHTIDQKLQASAYTSSAGSMITSDGMVTGCIVALQFLEGVSRSNNNDGGRKIVGQVCSLQREGILTIWSIIQEKKCIQDIGKAFWSKLRLERTQTISLIDNVDVKEINTIDNITEFNFNSAKRRLSYKKQEKVTAKNISRPNSTANFDRPVSAKKKVLPVEKNAAQNWESGVVCYDLKIMKLDRIDNYLVAKNCGEVLCCIKNGSAVKINKFCVTNDSTDIVQLCVSPHGLPYLLAGTDSGVVHLCSMREHRILLSLDCRNDPPSETIERCQSDHKGRFISTATVRTQPSGTYYSEKIGAKDAISLIVWPRHDPCCVVSVRSSSGVWGLTSGDIAPRALWPHPAVACGGNDAALITPEGTIQIHRLANQQEYTHHHDLFQKYVALL